MKLGKSLIIAGVLFSSVLGSINVGNVIVQAADDSSISQQGSTGSTGDADNAENGVNVGAEKSIDVIYKYGDKVLNKKSVKSIINADGTLSESKIEPVKTNNTFPYRIKSGQSFMVGRDSVSGTRYVNVQLEKLRTISVKVFLDGQPKKMFDIDVSDTDTTVSINQLGLNLEGIRAVDSQTAFNIDSDHIVRVNLETTRVVDVIYNDENGFENKIPFGELTVFAGKNELTLDEVPTPEGYTIVPGQRFKISKGVNRSLIRVKVKSNENLESLKPIAPKPNTKPAQPNGKPNTNSYAHPSKAGRYAIQKVQIDFAEQGTNNLVGYLHLVGKSTFSKKFEAPKGYSFVNAKDSTINFDKSGNKNLKIYVKKTTPTITYQTGTVKTQGGSYKLLYNFEGKQVTNRGLAANSSWYTDQFATINNEKMYRVATNEWVKATDVQ